MIKWSFLENIVNESIILPYASMNNSSNAEYPFDKWIRENKNKQDVINFFAKELREYKTMEEYFLDREEYILKKCLSI